MGENNIIGPSCYLFACTDIKIIMFIGYVVLLVNQTTCIIIKHALKSINSLSVITPTSLFVGSEIPIKFINNQLMKLTTL